MNMQEEKTDSKETTIQLKEDESKTEIRPAPILLTWSIRERERFSPIVSLAGDAI